MEKVLEFAYNGFYTVPEDVLTGATTRSMRQSPVGGPEKTAELETKSLTMDETNCHRYFHLRMYGLADYLVVDTLKGMAEAQFIGMSPYHLCRLTGCFSTNHRRNVVHVRKLRAAKGTICQGTG